MCKILINFQAEHDLRTIEEMISRWGRRHRTEITPRTIFRWWPTIWRIGRAEPFAFADISFARPLIEGIIFMENGRQPFDDSIIAEGIAVAEIDDEQE